MSTPVLAFGPGGGDVSVDLDRLVSSRLLVQANSGGGKSYAIRGLCERTHGRIQQLVIDPEGEFASLRERFDYVLAGRDGDVPAEPKAAKVLCRRLVELGASAVIDLYDLPLPERRRFVRLFLEELMHLPRSLWRPLLVVVDEAHLFCPEKGSAEAESKDAIISLCTQGRKRGFCAVLATQRIAKLDKDAAAELLNKLVGRTGLDVDVRRAGDDLGFDREQRQQLKFLPSGEWYTYGPAISREVVRVRTPPVVTTHPEPGKIAPPAPPAPDSVRKLLEQLRDLPAQAAEEARTLEEAQRRIRQLEGDLRRSQRPAPAAGSAATPDPRAINRAVEGATRQLNTRIQELERTTARAVETAARPLRIEVTHLRQRIDKAGRLAAQLVAALQNGDSRGLLEPREVIQAASAGPRPRPEVLAPPRLAQPTPPADPASGVSAPQQRILDALASLRAVGIEAPDRSNVAVFAGQSPTSSGYANNLGRLRTLGLIDYPDGGLVTLTEAGYHASADTLPLHSLAALHAAWESKLPRPQWRIVQALIEAWPERMTREDLAASADQSPTSSGYANNLGRLRTLGLIDYPAGGYVQAAKLLFPEGLS